MTAANSREECSRQRHSVFQGLETRKLGKVQISETVTPNLILPVTNLPKPPIMCGVCAGDPGIHLWGGINRTPYQASFKNNPVKPMDWGYRVVKNSR